MPQTDVSNFLYVLRVAAQHSRTLPHGADTERRYDDKPRQWMDGWMDRICVRFSYESFQTDDWARKGIFVEKKLLYKTPGLCLIPAQFVWKHRGQSVMSLLWLLLFSDTRFLPVACVMLRCLATLLGQIIQLIVVFNLAVASNQTEWRCLFDRWGNNAKLPFLSSKRKITNFHLIYVRFVGSAQLADCTLVVVL